MDSVRIEKWLAIHNGYGSGSGSGYGSGSGSGSGSGYGSGSGSGSGYGSGYGCGYGSGSGSGSGYGCGYGIKECNDMRVYNIDGIQTVITSIHGALAKGYVLQNYLVLTPCFIVKGHGYFAHGVTVEKAREALQRKIFANMDTDEAIDKFYERFRLEDDYRAKDFYEWHHYLTGSCEMGRQSFMKDHGISMDDLLDVKEFIHLCKDSYGGEIIKQLAERYGVEV